MASVKVYQNTGYKGRSIVCAPGEHSSTKFAGLFKYSTYCSIRIPAGYCLDVSYSPKGWKPGAYKTYTSNLGKLKCNFKKIRIRVCGKVPSGGDKINDSKPTCGSNWAIQFFENRNYGGQHTCFPAGYHKYETKFRSLPGSFAVKSGYEVLLYYRRKIVKKLSGSVNQSRYQFDQFKVQPKNGETSGCGRDWAVRVYQKSNYQGASVCYLAGTHQYQPSFRAYPKSIQVNNGYFVYLMYRGREVKRLEDSYSGNSIPNFDQLKVVKVDDRWTRNGSGQRSGTDPTSGRIQQREGNSPQGLNCGSDWGIQFFGNANYNGPSFCYARGSHSYTPGAQGYPRSIKINRNLLVLFLYRGEIVRKASRDIRNFNTRFDKVIVRSRR